MAQDSNTADSTATADKADDKDDDTSTLEEITVTGLRASVMSSIQFKKQSEQVVDSISAQDIGALPDRSVSEALQRVPGVTLQRTNENRDPARLAAEGGGVFVRGLSWVRSETNGRDVFSANNGRGLSFEDVSPDLLAGVDVYKNPSADMIEGGVGGLVNLRTRKPFDADGRIIAASVDYNYADLRDKGYWSGNALYSNRWQVGEEGDIGILLSGSIGNIGNRTDSIQLGRYEPTALPVDQDGLSAGTTVLIPNSVGWRRIDWQQKRTAFDGVLQFRPNSEMEFTFEALVAKATPEDIEHAAGIFSAPSNCSEATFNDDTKALETGSCSAANLDFDTRYGKSTKITRDFSGHWSWTPNENWSFSADVQRVSSEADVLSFTVFTELGIENGFYSALRPDYTFDFSGNTPSLQFTENTGGAMDDASNYWWAAAMDHIERNTAGSWAERADVEYSFTNNSFLKSFRMGIRATQKESITRQTGWNWGLLANQFWGNGGGAPVWLDEDPGSVGLPGQAELFTYDNFFRGDVGLPGVGWFPSADLVSNGTANAYSYLQSTLTSGWGWAPLNEDSYDSAAPGSDNVTGGISTQKERTKAIYGLLRFGQEDGSLGHFDGNLGLRVVQTDNTAIGLLTINAPQQVMSVDACTAQNGSAACADLAAAIAFTSGDTTLDNYEFKNKYTDVMPSLNLRFFLQEDLQLRLAVGRAIVRPNFAQMSPYNTLSFAFEDDGFTLKSVDGRTGNGGNPYLKPTKSNQFDISLEYYFANAASFTFAAFYKDIKDYVYAGSSLETYTANGQELEFNVTRSINGEEGSIKGFEVAYQQFFDFLPGALSGLGLQANFTFVDSSGGANLAVNVLDPAQIDNAADTSLPLEGLSRYAYNVALLYEKYGVSARLAYNWRDAYLLTTSAANLNAPVWAEDYGQLDGSVMFDITDNIKMGIQATNILNARTYLDVGGAETHPRYSWTNTDRRIAAVVRTRF
ncbi:MAG: TonB-dependent receptor [Alphaproteobacteria bacterium]|nr:MAG: TonB-dependent receptor [Alphaproteobacteria bacterium]